MNKPPHDCRSRGDCGGRRMGEAHAPDGRLTIAAVAATAAITICAGVTVVGCRLTIAAVAATAAKEASSQNGREKTASRLPQSRRLRPIQIPELNLLRDRLTIAAVAATAANPLPNQQNPTTPASRLPQSRRLRLCPGAEKLFGGNTASRLPQSRRLRQQPNHTTMTNNLTASRLPQSRRLRLAAKGRGVGALHRLTIAAVAATAAIWPVGMGFRCGPPHDCRSRGDCGGRSHRH